MNTNHSGESGNPEFDHLFDFENEEDQIASDTRLLSFGFLSELERHSDQSKGLKKRLAALIGTSASYITQLFNGDKIINLETVARFQRAMGIKFKIVAYKEEEFDLYCRFHEPIKNEFHIYLADSTKYGISTTGMATTKVQITENKSLALS